MRLFHSCVAAHAMRLTQVTDAHDRHTIMTILRTYYTPEIVKPEYTLSPSGVYVAPAHTDYKGYLEWVVRF